MATPHGWVSPQWTSLQKRPLLLGLPYGVAGFLIVLVLYFGVVLWLWIPALIGFLAFWGIGAALTRYDQFGWEILLGASRMPRCLRSS